jgi:hypothetical protein
MGGASNAAEPQEVRIMRYRIESKAGMDMGIYEGSTPEEAVRAMIADGDGEYGSESAGTVDDYLVEEVA